MAETKDLMKKSADLTDYQPERYRRTAYARIAHSSGSYACQCAAFPGIRLVAKTEKAYSRVL